jgi:hypothetical protein
MSLISKLMRDKRVRAAARPLLRSLRSSEAFRNWESKARYRIKYGFDPPRYGIDFVGYETLIEFIQHKDLLSLAGDFVEIGAFCGGGTYKLAQFLKKSRSHKKVRVIDVFDPKFDATMNSAGDRMCEIYDRSLSGKSQREIFNAVTKRLDNVLVYAQDSMSVDLAGVPVCFGFIDGNHDPLYVASDFNLVWKSLVPGGAVAFHDYGDDLPEVTAMVDQLRIEHQKKIASFQVDGGKRIAFIEKRR